VKREGVAALPSPEALMEASDRCCLAGPLTNGQAKPSTPWPTGALDEGPLRPDHSSPISCAEHTKSNHIS
jgi:hypothetical protein